MHRILHAEVDPGGNIRPVATRPSPTLINLQRDGKHAKVYQVRQVRGVLLRYRLGGDL